MCHHPQVQTKLQSEIDSVIGPDKFPSAERRRWMPYTDATMLEILRYGSQTSLAIPHKCNKDVILDGYLIEKDSVVSSILEIYVGAATNRIFIISISPINEHLWKPYSIKWKMGFSWLAVIFLITAQKHRLRVFVRTTTMKLLKKYQQQMFEANIRHNIRIYHSKNPNSYP